VGRCARGADGVGADAVTAAGRLEIIQEIATPTRDDC
jgi:hypothetical protein